MHAEFLIDTVQSDVDAAILQLKDLKIAAEKMQKVLWNHRWSLVWCC